MQCIVTYLFFVDLYECKLNIISLETIHFPLIHHLTNPQHLKWPNWANMMYQVLNIGHRYFDFNMGHVSFNWNLRRVLAWGFATFKTVDYWT